MAGDWIKMRPSLLTNPKVNGIARILEGEREVSRVLSTGFSGAMSEIVTRNVMRNVTVSCLLTVWGAANEHTTNGTFSNADLSDIDDMVGIPGFGGAMQSVGWLIHDEDACTVTLPNFNEYNTCGKDRPAEKNRERQQRYRDKKAAERNVTNDVTNNDREEKRREEKKEQEHTPIPPKGVAAGFAEFWSAYPLKKAKATAEKAWAKLKPSAELQASILSAIAAHKLSADWMRDGGQYIPHPTTWLNQRRWEDEVTPYEARQHAHGNRPVSAVDAVKQAQAERDAQAVAEASGHPLAENDGAVWEEVDEGFRCVG